MKTTIKRLFAFLLLMLVFFPHCLAESTYVSLPDESGTVTACRLYYINGHLLLERSMYEDGCFYCYDAAEILPHPAFDPGKKVQTFEAVIKRFSGFSMAGDYWEDEHAIVSFSEERCLTTIEENSQITKYLCTENDDLIHPESSYPDFSDKVTTDPTLIGEWCCSADDTEVYFDFSEDKHFTYLLKNEDQPIEVYFGKYAINDGGQLMISAQRMGYGEMPYDTCLDYVINDDTLLLTDVYAGLYSGSYPLEKNR